jgi:RNA polymerase sigma-70 factor, ECF subfamily
VNSPGDNREPTLAASETSDPGDQALALRAQQGDTRALETLVLRYQSEMAGLLWKFTRNHATLQDLVQDTFLRVVRGLPAWRADRPFAHWLRRIAVNTGRDHCRRQSVRRRWQVEPLSNDEDAPMLEAVDSAPDPAARAAANELKETLAQLPPDDRALLTLYYLDGWDLPKIARDFGWTHTATKLRAWRARQKLRALLEKPSQNE